jgi:hypothetical protein
MIKHIWELVDDTRVCRACGFEQEKRTDYLLARINKTRWLPLAGRCQGLPKGAPVRPSLGPRSYER